MSDPWTPQLNHCSSCLYWGTRQDYWNTIMHRTCDAPEILYGKDQLEGAMAMPATAVVETWEGWGWLVGPDFGCLHWVNAARSMGTDEAHAAAPEELSRGDTAEAAP